MGKKKDLAKQYTPRIDTIYEMAPGTGFSSMVEHLCISYLYNRNWTVNMVGISGIGKNEIVKKACELLGIEFILFDGLGKLPEDASGMPGYARILDESDVADLTNDMGGMFELAKRFAKKEPQYSYYLFDQIKPAFDPEWQGVLFFDEIAKCEEDLKKKLYQFQYDREVDGRKISDGCLVVSAMNPPSEAEYQLNGLDEPHIDRIQIFKVTSKLNDFLNWAKGDADANYGGVKARVKAARIAIEEQAKKQGLKLKKGMLPPCDSRSRKVSPTIRSYVAEKTQIFDDLRSRRIHHASDCLVATERYFQMSAFEINRSTDDRRILSDQMIGALTPEYQAEVMKFINDAGSISGVAILDGDKKAFDRLKKALKSDDRVVSLHSVHNEMEDAIINYDTAFKNLKRDDDGNIADGEAKRIAANYMKYLDFITEEASDTAVALIRVVTDNAASNWNDFKVAIDDLAANDFKKLAARLCTLIGTRSPGTPEEDNDDAFAAGV